MKLKIFRKDKMPYLLLIVMLIVFLLLCHNRLASLNATRENLLLQEKALAREEEHLLTLRQLEEEGPGFQLRLERFENLIPEEMAGCRQISSLQKITALSGMRLLQADFGDEKAGDGYVEVPLELSLEGSFGAVQKLLLSMREGKRAFRIDDLQIIGGQESVPLSVVLKAGTFYRPWAPLP